MDGQMEGIYNSPLCSKTVDNKTGVRTRTPRYRVTLRLQQESVEKETTLSGDTKVSVGSFVLLLTDTDNRNLSNVCVGRRCVCPFVGHWSITERFSFTPMPPAIFWRLCFSFSLSALLHSSPPTDTCLSPITLFKACVYTISESTTNQTKINGVLFWDEKRHAPSSMRQPIKWLTGSIETSREQWTFLLTDWLPVYKEELSGQQSLSGSNVCTSPVNLAVGSFSSHLLIR